jgi:hypothetical protein
MAIPFGTLSFSSGEISPALFGHADLARFRVAASTMRNFFVGFQGGALSRAGTALVGFSKQTGRSYPPRLLPFQFSNTQGLVLEFGNSYMRVIYQGAFVLESPVNITGASQANPCVLSLASFSYSAGDWLYVSGVGGMTQLNGNYYVIGSTGIGSVTLQDVFGNAVNSSSFGAYTSGGTVARVYTVASPFREADLAYLKWTQSADVMSICCRNQVSGAEYAPQELARNGSDTNFSFTALSIGQSAAAPSGTPTVVSSSGSSGTAHYQYQITSIGSDGSESIASAIGSLSNALDIAATAGSNTVTWNPVAGINNYNIYKAAEAQVAIPVGAPFGYAGTAAGNSWIDTNILPDFQQVPPINYNPFARNAITGAVVTAGGSGYGGSITLTINTSSGANAVLTPVVSAAGSLVDILVVIQGSGYNPATDTITIGGSGTGATATLTIGPNSQTYPSVVGYFQQRRVYANSGNNPDTYWMSQPGSYYNFNYRVPTIDSDSIIGSPWAQQVNGIQWLLSMPGGLIVFTGSQAWQLTGAGGSGLSPVAITPSDQQAQPQAFNGVSSTVPPVQVDYHILFADAVGSNVYDLAYQYWLNIYTGTDLTTLSTHLFQGLYVQQWAWTRQTNKLVWVVRSDGILLSLTYLPEQQVQGWARHDTQGLFVSVCEIIEPPVNAPYFAVQRVLAAGTGYLIERMDNRLWPAAENCWCVDCGLQLPHTYPETTLTASSSTGTGSITGVSGLVGGSGYSSATTAVVTDNNGLGPGSGAVPSLTISGGVITAVSFSGANGSGYVNPALSFVDPTGLGSGASAPLVLNNHATFQSAISTFSSGSVGSVIRMGGGVATIVSYSSPTSVVAQITSPIVQVIPNSGGVPQPAAAGAWSLDAPVSTVLAPHLAGMTVTGLADGVVIGPVQASSTGVVTLPQAATQVIVGLGFQAQLQSTYTPETTIQGQRKNVAVVTARVQATRGIKIGANQIDASTQSPMLIQATWNSMASAPDLGQPPFGSSTAPLYTGDVRIPIASNFGKPGQVAIQQDNPLPCNILALIPEIDLGDLPEPNEAPGASQNRRPKPFSFAAPR